MKSDTIILLGDFNCDLQGIESKIGSEIQPKTRRLLTLFQLFGMQNITNMPTRITPGSSTLIDLIVTTKPDLINRKGVLPLGISDHCLIYATLDLKHKRPPPKVINVRNYKQFQLDQLQLRLFTSLGFLRIRMMFSGHGISYSKIFVTYMHLQLPG